MSNKNDVFKKEPFITNAIAIGEEKYKGHKKIILFNIFTKSLFSLEEESFKGRVKTGDVYKIEGYKVNLEYEKLKVVEHLGSGDINQFLKKYKYCVNYSETDFNNVLEIKIEEDKYFLVNFTGSKAKKVEGKYGNKYQIRIGDIGFDLVNYKYEDNPDLVGKTYRGQALIKAYKINNKTSYKSIYEFGDFLTEEEWDKRDLKLEKKIEKEGLIGGIDDFYHMDLDDLCLEENDDMDEEIDEEIDEDTVLDELCASYHEYYVDDEYDDDYEDRCYDDTYDRYHEETSKDVYYINRRSFEHQSYYKGAINREKQACEEEYNMKEAMEYEENRLKMMENEAIKNARAYLEKKFMKKFYAISDVQHHRFALDYATVEMDFMDIPKNIRSWIIELAYLEDRNKKKISSRLGPMPLMNPSQSTDSTPRRGGSFLSSVNRTSEIVPRRRMRHPIYNSQGQIPKEILKIECPFKNGEILRHKTKGDCRVISTGDEKFQVMWEDGNISVFLNKDGLNWFITIP